MLLPTGYEMSEEDFDLLVEALKYKVEEHGTNTSDMTAILALVGSYWNILQDIPSIQAYVDSVRASKLQDEKTKLEARIAEIDEVLGQ